MARRVFPTPPGPVRVSNGAEARIRFASPISRSLPTKVVSWAVVACRSRVRRVTTPAIDRCEEARRCRTTR